MTWRNRQSVDADQKFEELEKEMSLENLQGLNVESALPVAGPTKPTLTLAKDGSEIKLILLFDGKRYISTLAEA